MERALTKSRFRHLAPITALVAAFAVWMAAGDSRAFEETGFLHPEQRHENVGELVTQIIEKSHYNQVKIDDDFSSEVLDNFVESLDRNRMYLMRSDVEHFETLRYKLDDMVRSRPLDPVFEMYEVYATRVRERLEFALTQLETEPDYTVDESYQFDRSEEPWLETSSELDEVWRRRVKNDALNLALDGESWEKIQDVLTKRYQGFLRRLDQVNNDDVFERFMNAFARTLDPHSSYLSPRNSEEYRIQICRRSGRNGRQAPARGQDHRRRPGSRGRNRRRDRLAP
jgi:carboxyl-terminal processing protease